MKKLIVGMLALLMGVCIVLTSQTMTVRASGQDDVDIEALLGDAKDKLSEAVSNLDKKTVKEIFEFIHEKVQDGSLKTEDGLKEAIEEGESRFGVTVSESDARKIIEVMEKLEDMGFSGEYVIERAEELYDRYGADFVDHADEVITEALEDAVTNAAENFFSNLWESAKNFFKNLFSGL
ncbi:MAG: DUF1002 domain-containing protein [Suilimivivens sp.]